jgi:anti-sigma factor RsiW
MNAGTSGVECIEEGARLLPWYVTGRLTEDEKTRVERHLEQCAVCRDDVVRERQVHALLHGRGPVEYAPQGGLGRTLARIDELEREAPARPSPASNVAPRATAATRWLAAAVVVQAVGLGVLVVARERGVAMPSGAAEYRTLASTSPAAAPATIRVVFAPTMTIAELWALLAREGLSIVAGPSAAGTYALAPSDGSRRETATTIANLRADPRVLFAEPIADREARAP